MGRPPLELGTAGRVRVYPYGAGYRARALYRDFDGKTRPVEAHGKTKGAAERALGKSLRDRARFDADSLITPETQLSVVAELWFTELSQQDRSPSTIAAYRDRLDRQIIPALGSVRVRELSVGLVDRHLNAVKLKNGASVAKLTRSVLSGVCNLACRHDALDSNPCRDVAKISAQPKSTPRALSITEIKDLRLRLSIDKRATQKDLPDLVAFMLATGMRSGEVCALRWNDVDLGAGTVHVRGTVLRVKGQGLIIKPRPKTKAGDRILELPTWATKMLQDRATRGHSQGPVFPTELGNLRDPSNTRHDLRQALDAAGYSDVTSRAFRKTVVTLMDEAGLSARSAADQLGHAQVSVTQDVYFGRKRAATGAAAVLEQLD